MQKRRQPRPVINCGFDAARHRTIGPEAADRLLYRLTENPIEPSTDIARRIDRLAAGICEFLRGLRSFLNRFRFVGHKYAPQNNSLSVQWTQDLIAKREEIDAELVSIFGGKQVPRRTLKSSVCNSEGHTARTCPTKQMEI